MVSRQRVLAMSVLWLGGVMGVSEREWSWARCALCCAVLCCLLT